MHCDLRLHSYYAQAPLVSSAHRNDILSCKSMKPASAAVLLQLLLIVFFDTQKRFPPSIVLIADSYTLRLAIHVGEGYFQYMPRLPGTHLTSRTGRHAACTIARITLTAVGDTAQAF